MGRAKPAAPAKGDAPAGGNIWQVLLTGARKGEGKGKGAAPAAPAPEQAGVTRWRITPRGLAYLQELEGCSGQGQGPLASGLVSEPWPAAEETPEAAPAEAPAGTAEGTASAEETAHAATASAEIADKTPEEAHSARPQGRGEAPSMLSWLVFGENPGPLLEDTTWPAAEETPEAAPAEASPEAAAAEEISEETQEGTAGWLEDLFGGGAAVAAAEAARPRAEAARPHAEAPEAI